MDYIRIIEYTVIVVVFLMGIKYSISNIKRKCIAFEKRIKSTENHITSIGDKFEKIEKKIQELKFENAKLNLEETMLMKTPRQRAIKNKLGAADD